MINDNHRTLLHQIADAIARSNCATSASLHPLLEDYLPHAHAALEVLTGHLDALEDEADLEFNDDRWDHGYYGALNDIRESTRELTDDPAAEYEAEYLRAEAMNEYMNDFKHEDQPR